MESSALGMSSAPEEVPRGPHSLPRDVVVSSQRTRMLRALVSSARQ